MTKEGKGKKAKGKSKMPGSSGRELLPFAFFLLPYFPVRF
jgi:hypothetical protein